MTIAFVPADLPKIPYSEKKYWEFFNENKSKTKSNYLWASCLLTDTDLTDEQKKCPVGGYYSCQHIEDKIWWWKDIVKQQLPELIQFLENLPLKLTHVSMLSNIKSIPIHQDLHSFPWSKSAVEKYKEEVKYLEPVVYRIMLAGDRISSFFITPNNIDNAICITLPKETDTFLINATNFYHGAHVTTSKLVCFVNGFICHNKHKELLNRSVKTFSDYIIRF